MHQTRTHTHTVRTVRAIYEMLPEHTYIVRHDYCILFSLFGRGFWASGWGILVPGVWGLGHVHSI